MKAIYQPTGSKTVNQVVADLFDVRDPVSFVTSGPGADARLARMAEALRAVNPGLPTDETSFSVPFLWIPSIPSYRLRVHWDLRGALEAIGIYTNEQLVSCRLSWLETQLGSPNDAQAPRALQIGRLMRVVGLGPQLAADLVDGSPSFLSASDLVKTDQDVLKTRLDALSLPAEYVAHQPWYRLQRRAAVTGGAPRKPPARWRPRAADKAFLRKHALTWKLEAQSERRGAKERESARIVGLAYNILEHVGEASLQSTRGRHAQAAAHIEKVYALYGQEAVRRGLAAAGSDAAAGPSLELVLSVTGVMLDGLDDEDCDVALRAAGHSESGVRVRGCTMDHLDIGLADDVTNALGNGGFRVADLGSKRLRRLRQQTTDAPAASLPWAPTSLTTLNTGSRVRDYSEIDRSYATENARSATFSQLFTDPVIWMPVRAELPLHDVRGIVGSSLDQGGPTPMLAVALSPTAKTELGLNGPEAQGFLNATTPFDRWVEWAAPNGATYRAPTNASFAERYRLDVLKPLLEQLETDSSVVDFSDSDLLDPAGMLLLAPVLFARHFPLMLSAAAFGIGDAASGQAWFNSRPQIADLSGVLDTSLADLRSVGTSRTQVPDCPSPPELYGLLREWLNMGESAYRRDDPVAAIDQFERLITRASQCPWIAPVFEDDPPDSGGPGVNLPGDFGRGIDDWLIVDQDLLLPPLGGWFDTGPIRTEDDSTRELYGTVGLAAVDWIGTQYYSGVTTFDSDESFKAAVRYIQTPDGGTGISGQSGVFNPNDYRAEIQAVVLQAALHLRSIKHGLNWLGFPSTYIPIWSFDYLIGQALSFASRAEQLRSQALSLLSQGEAKSLAELQQTGQVSLSKQRETMAALEVEISGSQREEASKSVEAAEQAVSRAKSDRLFSVVSGAMSLLSVATGAGAALKLGKEAGKAVKAVSVLAGAAGQAGSVAASVARTAGSVGAAKSDLDVARQRLNTAVLQTQLAAAGQSLARMQSSLDEKVLEAMDNAETNSKNLLGLYGVISDIASAQLRMATIMAWMAQRALWYESRRNVRIVQLAYGDSGFVGTNSGAARLRTDLDTLVQNRVLSKQQPDQLIKTTISVAESNATGLLAIAENGGVDILVDQKALDLRFPGLYGHRLKRVEVDFVGLLPFGGITGVLRRTGTAQVRVPFTTDYVPELFAVGTTDDPARTEIIKDWSYPPGEGAAPDVFTYDVSKTADDNFAPFVMARIPLIQQAQVLSEYRRAQDGSVLSVQPGVLDTLENSPPTGRWFVELPPQASDRDVRNIVDIRLTLYFSAEYSGPLAAQQAHTLANASEAEISRSWVKGLADQDVGALQRFIEPPFDPSKRDLRLAVFDAEDGDLPGGFSTRKFDNFFFALLGLQGRALTVSVKSSLFPFGDRQATNVVTGATPDPAKRFPDGVVASNQGRSTHTIVDPDTSLVFPALEGFQPKLDAVAVPAVGADISGTRWVLKALADADNTAFEALDDDGDVQQVDGSVLQLAGGGVARITDGDWAHVEVEATIEPKSGAFALTLREGGTHPVIARVRRLTNAATTKLELQLYSGTPPTGDGSNQITSDDHVLDDLYRLRAVVTKTEAVLYLDEIEVLRAPVPASTGGSVQMAFFASTTMTVSDVRVTRLRYNGDPLEVVLDERFADASAWTLTPGTGTAARADATHRLLDLNEIGDVLVSVDYNASLNA